MTLTVKDHAGGGVEGGLEGAAFAFHGGERRRRHGLAVATYLMLEMAVLLEILLSCSISLFLSSTLESFCVQPLAS